MCQADHAALGVDLGRGVDRRQAWPDGLVHVQRDQIARRRAHFLTDDDGQSVGRRVARAERAVDAVVVGDREVVEATMGSGARDLLRLGERIE
jgi:hypothetical protein